jgi:glyoxylase-like metal-dependent hydrolase (beta-lactamase superfamily II)
MPSLELVKLTGDSFVIPGPTNIGVITRGGEAYLVDGGNDKDAGRKILRLLEERGLRIAAILATHSNADHIGGNEYLQNATGCRIFATRSEKALIESPGLETALLWGGMPPAEIQNKFFVARPSRVTDEIIDMNALGPRGIEFVPLPGHFLEMVGVMTADGVFYIADSMFGEKVLEKHGIPFIYDVAAYKETIRKVAETEAKCFVMSHGDVATDIKETADRNLYVLEEVEGAILSILRRELPFDAVLKGICDEFKIDLGFGQYALTGSTVRSFLAYLRNEGKIAATFRGNEMLWGLAGSIPDGSPSAN